MLAEFLRLAVGIYFFFSGINKIFFFDQFSGHLSSFFKLSGELAFALGAAVIALEIVFAAVIIFWNGKLVPRILALTLAVPFIAYNLWIFFVLGLQSCNCTYSASGESMTGPLFSITVLLLTLAAVFYFTRTTERSFNIPTRAGVLVLIVLITAGTSAYFRYQFENDDLIALRQLISAQANQNETIERPEYEIFVQHPNGRPMRAAAFLEKLLQQQGDTAIYVIRSESVKLVDDMLLNVQQKAGIEIIDPPDNSRFETLGVQIYRNGALVYRHDQLPEMTAALYEEIIAALSENIADFSACDTAAASAELMQIIEQNRDITEAESSPISVNLIMERDCAECDADLLAMLDNYFYDPERFEVNITYFMASNPENGRGKSISPTELAKLQHWCLYPHKLLLINFGGGDIAVFPVPAYLGDLDQAINSAFEQRDLQLF